MKKTIIIILLILSAGCASTSVRQTTLVEELRSGADTQHSYTADNQWWRQYNDPELDRLVDTALKNNADLASSAASITVALYQAKIAGVDQYPTLSGSLGASTRKDLTDGSGFTQSFSGEVGLSYELDFFNKAGDTAVMKTLEYEATVLDMDTARLVLVNSVTDVYYNLAYLHGALDIAKQALKHAMAQRDIALALYREGKEDSAQYVQAEQSVLAAQDSLANLNDQIESAGQTLRNLLNIRPDDALDVRYVDLQSVRPLGVDLDVPLSVLADRPDLRAAELRLKKSFKNVEISDDSWFPTVSLRTAVSSSSDTVGEVFNFPLLTGSLSISMPFLQWNTVRYNIKISETEYNSALTSFESSVNTALNEVAYNYYAYTVARELYNNSAVKSANAARLAEYSSARYTAGKSGLSELLSAQDSLNAAQKERLNNTYQLIKYENMVYKSMAGRYTGGKELSSLSGAGK